MGSDFWGEELETVDMSTGVRVFQRRTDTENVILLALRAQLQLENNPIFDDIFWEIWSWNGTTPGVKLATSTNVQTKADLLGSDISRAVESWWEFDYFPMKAGETYCFVPRGTNYTHSTQSHIALIKDWPFPADPEGAGYGLRDLGLAKFRVLFFTGDYE